MKPKFLLLALPLAILFVFGMHINSAAAAPPTGFSTQTVINAGLDNPTAFALAPDGRIFVIEQPGKIKIYSNGQLLSQDFAELPAATTQEQGLLGIAFDPDFSTNHFVYFYYINNSDLSRHVVRMTADTNIASGPPVDIYVASFPAAPNHVAGGLAFGPDGKLYIGVGDNHNPANAQDLTNPLGKILRINKDGSIPSDNPFVGVTGDSPEIWAYGFRNPFRLQFDSQTGNLYVGDVGENSWEEINMVQKGGNYGWPLAEGICTGNCTGLINPIYTYAHSQPGPYAVMGGPVYRGSMFPPQYQGRLFFGDFGQGFIKTLDPVNPAQALDFDTSAGAVVDMKNALDGSLYYLTIAPGRLFRVTFNTPPPPPDSFKGEYFNDMTLSGSPALTRQDPAIDFDWGHGSPDPAINDDNFSIRWTKQQDFTAGNYKFTATADDGVRLFVDDKLIIDEWKDQARSSYSTVVALSAGTHSIRMEYYEAFGGANAKLVWQPTTDPVASFPDYMGQYFSNQNLWGSPVLTRNDPAIDFVWNDGSPDPLVPNDQFSAIWRKTLNLTAGTYNFQVTSDDGVRLFIDNEEVIDQWNDHASTTFNSQRTLTAGDHSMRMEYYEAFGGAIAKFSFSKVGG